MRGIARGIILRSIPVKSRARPSSHQQRIHTIIISEGDVQTIVVVIVVTDTSAGPGLTIFPHVGIPARAIKSPIYRRCDEPTQRTAVLHQYFLYNSRLCVRPAQFDTWPGALVLDLPNYSEVA